MSFMQQQITQKTTWVKVETDQGTEYIDGSLVGFIRDSNPLTHPLKAKEREQIIAELSQYCEGTIESWESIQGYGARLSAPGYMDCTEWCVFDSAEEAQEYLDETYPEDEEEN